MPPRRNTAHEHWFTALWSHLGPYGPQDVHIHDCIEGEPGDCHEVIVGPGRDCDGKRETHRRDRLPLMVSNLQANGARLPGMSEDSAVLWPCVTPAETDYERRARNG